MLFYLHSKHLTVAICDRGAELYSVQNNLGMEYIWQGNPKYWEERATNIFPVCGRLFGGYYTHINKSYKMDIHGFAKDSIFTPIKQTQNSIIFELTSSKVTREQYPFDFVLNISYKLIDNRLECDIEVLNSNNCPLPFSLGIHPGFNIPISPGRAFEDYYLQFSEPTKPELLLLTKSCFSSGYTIPFPIRDDKFVDLRHDLFDNDAIFLTNTPNAVALKSDKDKHSVTLSCSDTKYLGFWHTANSDAPFICMEPWCGSPSRDGIIDDIYNKPDMIHLAPGANYNFNFSLDFN